MKIFDRLDGLFIAKKQHEQEVMNQLHEYLDNMYYC